MNKNIGYILLFLTWLCIVFAKVCIGVAAIHYTATIYDMPYYVGIPFSIGIIAWATLTQVKIKNYRMIVK